MISKNAQQTVFFEEFEVDASHRRLLRHGEPLSLYAKTFDLLAFLVEHNGNVVTKDEILDAVWPGQIVEESNLSVQIAALRKALGEKKKSPRFLITVPGKGYKFVAEVEKEDEVVVERHRFSHVVVEEEVNDDMPQSVTRRVATADHKPSYSVLFFAGALTLSLLIAGGLIYQYRSSDRQAAIPFAGEPVRQLTTKGTVNLAVISPDGKFYAYTLFERGEYKNSLWVGMTEGGADIQLRPPDDNSVVSGLAFSPDGKSLYFSLTRGEESQGVLFRIPVIGGVAEKLMDNVSFRFALSPNGDQIAYFRQSRERDAPAALVTANLDGSGEREIITRMPDRRFSSFRPAWSPDGSKLAFGAVNDSEKQSNEIFTVGVTDGRIEQITSAEWFGLTNLIWLRDGLGLIACATSKDEPRLRHLWHVGYPDGTVSRISQDADSYVSALSTSSDGRALLAVQLLRESNIWIAPADDLSAARQVTFSSVNGLYGWNGFDWAADGTIVFSAGVENSVTLSQAALDGGSVKQITSAGFFDQTPAVTADGAYIVFQSNRGGGNGIWRVNADGSDLRHLTTGGGNMAPHVTPDGKWVIYTSIRADGRFLSQISIEGGDSTDLIGGLTNADPRISPDGKLVAYGYKQDSKLPTRLGIFSIDDGKPVHSFDLPRTANLNQSLRWTPDGKAVCYRDWADGIWCQGINGVPPKKLDGLPAEKLYNFGWSPDGKLFAFTRGREIRDAVLIRDSR